jgi:hypothetical protein
MMSLICSIGVLLEVDLLKPRASGAPAARRACAARCPQRLPRAQTTPQTLRADAGRIARKRRVAEVARPMLDTGGQEVRS